MTATHAAVERIETVTASTFPALVLAGRGPIVVEFMSYGCAHCRALEPVIQEVAAMLVAEVSFYRVNVAVDAELENTYGIRGTPTVIAFLDGKEVGRVEGPHPVTKSLLDAVSQAFSQ